MERKELLDQIQTSRARLESALSKFRLDQMNEPILPDGWSVKDLFTHLGWWEFRVVDIYGTLTKGATPRIVIDAENVDRVNKRVIDEYKSHPLEEMRMYERQAYNSLLKIVETAPEQNLFNRHQFLWTQGEPLVNWIIRNTYEHYDDHAVVLEHCLANLEGLASATGATGGFGPVLLKAREFIQQNGRDIEKVQFDFHFDHAPIDDLMEVLGRYQNEDGGFYGLEVDIQAPQSNPFATELALVAMRWADTPRDHLVLRRTVQFLEDTQQDDGTWRFSPEIYQNNLAPWFQGWQWPNLNPSCTIAGLLKQLGLGSTLLHNRVEALFEKLATPGDLTGKDYYQARPYAYYFQTEQDFPLAVFYRWGVVWWMVRQYLDNNELDAAHWLDFAPTPRSAIASRLPDDILRALLDKLVADQAEDGGWPTPYDAKWRGWNTICNLLALRAHGRL